MLNIQENSLIQLFLDRFTFPFKGFKMAAKCEVFIRFLQDLHVKFNFNKQIG